MVITTVKYVKFHVHYFLCATFMGEISLRDQAETALAKALTDNGIKYKVNPKDGAFYGPKINNLIQDSLGRQKDQETGTVNLRSYKDSERGAIPPADLKTEIVDHIKNRVLDVNMRKLNLDAFINPEDINAEEKEY